MKKSEINMMTVYGILAAKHNTTVSYVGIAARKDGTRKSKRGKAAEIVKDLQRIRDCFEDWITEFRADKTMIVKMEEIDVEVCVKNGTAKIYKGQLFQMETEIGELSLNEFKDFLNRVRVEFN